MAEDQPGFISRWSRLKREGGGEAEAAPKPEAVDGEALLRQQEAEAAELEANCKAAEAVDIETLGYESDFSVFLKRGVPDVLKKQALRKLWTSSPVLANLDGLNDYEADYGDPKLNTFNSLWQVGRGYLGLDDTPEPVPDEAPQTIIGEIGNPEEQDLPQKTVDMDSAGEGGTEEVAGPVEVIGENVTEETPDQANGLPRISIRKRLMG